MSMLVYTSQSRLGGENSSLRAGKQAGKRDRGQAWVSRRARQARRVMVQEPTYPGTFLTCPQKVLSICIGSAGLPRLASCKCLLSPLDYHQAASRYVPRRAVRCGAGWLYRCGSTELCHLCALLLYISRSSGLVSRYPRCSRYRFCGVYPPSTVQTWVVTKMFGLFTTTCLGR